jgi:hypothetical protein
MMGAPTNKPKPGEMVLLVGLPSGFLDDLPQKDQRALREMVGKPILLSEYDEDGRAVLEFTEADGGTGRTIYVDPRFIEAIR